MRDAFGGAFSIKLMLIFLMLYISFICVAINYARAFRVKNRIINIIEQREGYATDIVDDIQTYLNNSGYHIEYTDVKSVSSCNTLNEEYDEIQTFVEPGYCIAKNRPSYDPNKKNQDYYLIETYMVFSIPVIRISFPIAVRGETRVIETP